MIADFIFETQPNLSAFTLYVYISQKKAFLNDSKTF